MIADSDRTVEKDGNLYFPPNTVDKKYLEDSRTHKDSPGMGEASFYHVQVKGKVKQDGAWYYPDPEEDAKDIRGYIAFSNDIELKE